MSVWVVRSGRRGSLDNVRWTRTWLSLGGEGYRICRMSIAGRLWRSDFGKPDRKASLHESRTTPLSFGRLAGRFKPMTWLPCR